MGLSSERVSSFFWDTLYILPLWASVILSIYLMILLLNGEKHLDAWAPVVLGLVGVEVAQMSRLSTDGPIPSASFPTDVGLGLQKKGVD